MIEAVFEMVGDHIQRHPTQFDQTVFRAPAFVPLLNHRRLDPVAASALLQMGWCRKNRALSGQGCPVAPQDNEAAYWSLVGSLEAHRERSAQTIHPEAVYAALLAIYHTLHEKSPQSTDLLCHAVDCWNDQTPDRAEVLDRLAQALEGYDALVGDDIRFCPPTFPKADLSAARYIELIEQGAIPCPCSQIYPRR